MTDRHQNYFACLGPARSGTTWLHRYLRHHSTAKMTVLKELHWFDTATGVKVDKKRARMVKRWDSIQKRLADTGCAPRDFDLEVRDRAFMQTDTDYRRFFTSRFAPHAVFGDITPSYARLQDAGYERMLEVFPKAKLILLLRNPADNMWSRTAHARKNGRVTGSMEDVLKRRIPQNDPDTNIPRLENTYAKARAHVSHSRIHCLFTEDLFSEAANQTLQDLCQFLGITGAAAVENDFTENRGTYDPMPDGLRRATASTFAQSYHFAEDLMGRVPASWRSDMESF